MKKDFFKNNRKKLTDSIGDNSLLVLFSGSAPQKSADEVYEFVVNKNFYYMTGTERENFALLIYKNNGETKETLFIEKVTPLEEKWTGKRMTQEEAREISGIENIEAISNFKNFFNSLMLRGEYSKIYLDLEKRGWDSISTPALKFANDVAERYPYLRIKNIYHKIAKLRMVKTKEEIEMIKNAISITNKGIKSLMRNARPGMLEYQLEAYFDFEIKTLGSKRFAFKTIAASGENATVLHYDKNNCEIKENELILFDLGAQYKNYCADISRTFPINGKFTDRQKQIYEIVLKAELETIKAVKPGLPFRELNNVTKKVLAEECKKIGLIKEDSEISKYYYHGVSHYLGLDTHDVGDYDVCLQPGMVLTVEPGLYIEEEKIGIRIEDNVVVTENGCDNLSSNIIKNIEDIEAFMNK
ncbi:aminopeptidase P family protein [Brassicibacter mesophilus]|uniref:aminopeptidase P family protein n=1 Tax=Brassicibacter mesophilus TaxID=745119 RepID=UPI003D1FEAE7